MVTVSINRMDMGKLRKHRKTKKDFVYNMWNIYYMDYNLYYL